jgi:2-dehydropantoate 2-reductase
MEKFRMKVCVYGAGAVGGSLAARLWKNGARVSVIARGRNLAAIRANGLKVMTPAGNMIAHVDATDDPASLPPQDVIVVAVKAPALHSIAAGLEALVGADTSVVFVMNGIPWWYLHGYGGPLSGREIQGLDAERAMLCTVGVRRAVGGVIFGHSEAIEPGVVRVESGVTKLILGHADDRKPESLDALGGYLRADDFVVEITDNIRRGVWSKLQVVACAGLFSCITDLPPSAAYEAEAAKFAARLLFAELGAIADAAGYPTGLTAEDMFAIARNQKRKPSIAADLERGRPIEFDAMFGVPLELARLMNVHVPTFELLAPIVRRLAMPKGAYSAPVAPMTTPFSGGITG